MIPINSINRFTFVMKMRCLFCKEGIQYLNSVYMTSSFYVLKLWVSFLSRHLVGLSLKNVLLS
jgi:hypothetical protein